MDYIFITSPGKPPPVRRTRRSGSAVCSAPAVARQECPRSLHVTRCTLAARAVRVYCDNVSHRNGHAEER